MPARKRAGKKSFDIASEANRNRNAKPRSNSKYEAKAIEKNQPVPLARSLLRCQNHAPTNKRSLV